MGMSMGSFAGRSVATVIVATDGTGDFTDIQKAIDSLPATGGVVYIKEGTYTLTAPLTVVNDNISLIGSGASTLLRIATPINCVEVTADKFYFTQIRIQSTSYPGGFLVSRGIYLNNSAESKITDCWILGLSAPIYCINASQNDSYMNNFIDWCETGIDVFSADGIIIGNTIKNASYYGIVIHSTAGTTIIGNRIKTSITGGIYLTLSSRCNVQGNFLDGGTGEGIYIYTNSDLNVVTGNYITNSAYGIRINAFAVPGAGSSNNVCSNNIIEDCTDAVHILNANNVKNLILGNQLIDNTTNITDGGTSTQIAHNVIT